MMEVDLRLKMQNYHSIGSSNLPGDMLPDPSAIMQRFSGGYGLYHAKYM
jgi:hypothetical protein